MYFENDRCTDLMDWKRLSTVKNAWLFSSNDFLLTAISLLAKWLRFIAGTVGDYLDNAFQQNKIGTVYIIGCILGQKQRVFHRGEGSSLLWWKTGIHWCLGRSSPSRARTKLYSAYCSRRSPNRQSRVSTESSRRQTFPRKCSRHLSRLHSESLPPGAWTCPLLIYDQVQLLEKKHQPVDHSVKDRASVVKALLLLLTGAKKTEVLSSPWNHIGKQLDHDAAGVLIWGEKSIKNDSWFNQ